MNQSNKRIAFFGTPEFALGVLEALSEAGVVPALIVTGTDKPAGRGLKLSPPPVKDWALMHDIPFIQPKNLTDDPDLDSVMNSEWDAYIVAAYGRLLPPALLEVPAHGILNVHPSLLPRFRGPSPIESQLLLDERTVGVSIMQLDSEMDHGPVLAAAAITPDPWPLSARELERLLAHEGGILLAEVLPPYLSGSLKPVPQDHAAATYTRKITKQDGEIDLTADPYQNYLKFCAYDGWPGTYFFADRRGARTRVKIVEATYERGSFMPLRVLPEGKREMNYQDFLRG